MRKHYACMPKYNWDDFNGCTFVTYQSMTFWGVTRSKEKKEKKNARQWHFLKMKNHIVWRIYYACMPQYNWNGLNGCTFLTYQSMTLWSVTHSKERKITRDSDIFWNWKTILFQQVPPQTFPTPSQTLTLILTLMSSLRLTIDWNCHSNNVSRQESQ